MNIQSLPKSYVSEILARIVGPDEANLNPEAARALLELGLGETDRQRAHELVVKNQSGLLTSDELEEMDAYRRIGTLFGLLHAKARRSLKLAELEPVAQSNE